MTDQSQGTWVSFAVLCEKWIEDKFGRISLINIVDQVNVTPTQDGMNQPLVVQVSLVAAIGFKGGILKGAGTNETTDC